jgi:hypothetical protein
MTKASEILGRETLEKRLTNVLKLRDEIMKAALIESDLIRKFTKESSRTRILGFLESFSIDMDSFKDKGKKVEKTLKGLSLADLCDFVSKAKRDTKLEAIHSKQ